MKLRNKKTGEIGELLPWVDYETKKEVKEFAVMLDNHKEPLSYGSLAELNEEWKDYEEPKEDYIRVIESFIHYVEEADDSFYCDESVRKIVKKLKAWKRLKDKGFRFCGHDDRDRGQLGDIVIYAEMPTFEYDDDSTRDDLDLLFGGKA